MSTETVEVDLDAFRMIRLEKFLRRIDGIALAISKNMIQNGHFQQSQEYAFSELYNALRPYQRGGVEWMLSLHRNGANGILADEMGLGKTIQVIAFLVRLSKEYGINGPHVIVGPMSVIENWGAEIKKFAELDIDCHIHYGSDKESRENKLNQFKKKKLHQQKTIEKSKSNSNCIGSDKLCRTGGTVDLSLKKSPHISVIITTYELAIRDINFFKKKFNDWNGGIQYLVVDEAHRIKNRHSILYKKLSELNVQHSMLLTGTPLQNNIQELWSLLSFILPGLFHSNSDFQQWFNRPFEGNSNAPSIEMKVAKDASCCSPATSSSGAEKKVIYRLLVSNQVENTSSLTSDQRLRIIQSLHRVLKPFFLRRVKSEVAIDLPPKVEKILYCPMYPLQALLHRMLRKSVEHQEEEKMRKAQWRNRGTPGTNSTSTPGLSGLRQLLRDQDDGSCELQFNNLVMQLRKICNHPYLLLEDIEGIPDEYYFPYLLSSCGKLTVLNELVNALLVNNPDSKILVFSQMTSTLNIIEGLFHNQGIRSYRLDGNTAKVDRDLNIRKFSSVSQQHGEDMVQSTRVFLLTTRAGGVGINLQAADTVIMYDSDWNPQQDLQAISRVHRIGQRRSVLVIRLLSVAPEPGTTSVEEYVWRKAQRKLEAGNEVLGKNIFDMGTAIGGMELDEEDEDWTDYLTEFNNLKGNSGNSGIFGVLKIPKDVGNAVNNLRSNDSVDSFATTHSDCSNGSSVKLPSIAEVEVLQYFDEKAVSILCNRDLPDKTLLSFKIPAPQDENSHDTDQQLYSVWSKWLDHFKIGPSREELIQSLICIPTTTTSSQNNITCSKNQQLSEETILTPVTNKSRRKSLMRMFESEEDNTWLERNSCLASPVNTLFKSPSRRKRKLSQTEYVRCTPSRKSKPSVRRLNKRSTSKLDIKFTDDDSTIENEKSDEELDLCCVCNEHILSDDVIQCIIEGDINIDDDIRDTMVICDGCDGSYHLLCVDLYEVPADDWFCRFCVVTSTNPIKAALPPCDLSPIELIEDI